VAGRKRARSRFSDDGSGSTTDAVEGSHDAAGAAGGPIPKARSRSISGSRVRADGPALSGGGGLDFFLVLTAPRRRGSSFSAGADQDDVADTCAGDGRVVITRQ